MDDLTHVLVGTLIAQTIPSQKKGLVLACVLGAVAPDLDVVLSLFNHQLYVSEHRGFTHSLWGILPIILFAAWGAWLFIRKKSDGASFPALIGMALLGDLSHLALDWCTSWIRARSPFHPRYLVSAPFDHSAHPLHSFSL
jgi:inner membrane protein